MGDCAASGDYRMPQDAVAGSLTGPTTSDRRQTGQPRSEVVRDALRRQLTLRLFEEARRKVIPFAEAQGIYTDEDVFKLMS